MEFYTVEKINNWYFKIKLPYIDRQRLQYNQETLVFKYVLQRYVKGSEIQYLYQEEVGDGEFVFQIGYATFIYNEFSNELTDEGKSVLESMIFSDTILPKFPNLYDDQNKDLKQLVTLRRGMFQTYTGYGKSEVIATLTNYIGNVLNQKVLIVTANSTPLNEIKNRLYDLFKIDLDYFDYESNINAINLNGFLKSSWYEPSENYWTNDLWILADEVENCCSETAMEFYESLPNVTRMYGFSATSDKKAAEPVYSRVPDSFIESEDMVKLLNSPFNRFNNRIKYDEKLNEYKSKIRDIIGRNKYLVGYYGTSAVFKRPNNFKITMIDISSSISKDDINIPPDYVYSEVIYELFTSEKVCKLIEAVTYKVGMIFIPMFRLQVIDYWLDTIFKKDDFLVLVISGRGYELYENGELLGQITISEMKKMVRDGVIGVILGTKSSYGALDLPELDQSFLLYSKTANVVIQAIGRTARKGDFKIYSIVPAKTIPVYSKDLISRKSLIYDYYRDCNIVEYKYIENLYGYKE